MKKLISLPLKTITIAFFIPLLTFTEFVLGWIVLGIIILGGLPQYKAAIILVILLILLTLLVWVIKKYIVPFKYLKYGLFIYTFLAIVVWSTWALTVKDDAVLLARDMVWGESDVLDYQKFPERVVAKGDSTFYFEVDKQPQLFESIKYTQDDQEKESSLDDLLKSSNTTSFIIIKDGKIIYEDYFNGYTRDSIVTSFSTAKSFTSALIGIAIDEGYIDSVEDPIIKYLPEVKGRGYDTLTIKDLLLMSTGVKYVHTDDLPAYKVIWPYKDDTLSYSYTDMRKLALGLEGDGRTQVAFNYNQYHPLLLGLILERTTGMSVSEFTQEKLWRPIGAEFDASWSLDSKKHGFEKMESGFNGRAIDFAKFGYLFLNNGEMNDKQIISQDWVKESTSPDPNDDREWLSDQYWVDDFGGYYMYMWWGKEFDDGSYIYFANGHLGQHIAVAPKDNVVVVRFGKDEGGINWAPVFIDIVNKTKAD